MLLAMLVCVWLVAMHRLVGNGVTGGVNDTGTGADVTVGGVEMVAAAGSSESDATIGATPTTRGDTPDWGKK